jgi:hypothetical protein
MVGLMLRPHFCLDGSLPTGIMLFNREIFWGGVASVIENG